MEVFNLFGIGVKGRIGDSEYFAGKRWITAQNADETWDVDFRFVG